MRDRHLGNKKPILAKSKILLYLQLMTDIIRTHFNIPTTVMTKSLDLNNNKKYHEFIPNYYLCKELNLKLNLYNVIQTIMTLFIIIRDIHVKWRPCFNTYSR